LNGGGEIALAHASALAKAHEAELVLVHASGVTDTGFAVHDEAERSKEPWAEYVRTRMQRAEGLLSKLQQRLVDRGVKTIPRLSSGFADAAIVSAAHQLDADLVVVGTHGRTGGERWLLGSVAESVLRLSERSVLVARKNEAPHGRPKRMLVATDFSRTAERGLDMALALAAPDANIEVVHCWQDPQTYGVPLPPEVHRRLVERAISAGNALLALHGAGAKQTLHFDMVDAPPVAGLLKRLDEGDAELLVLGTHGRRGAGRLILGSVASQVARHATRSVLVVSGHSAGDPPAD